MDRFLLTIVYVWVAALVVARPVTVECCGAQPALNSHSPALPADAVIVLQDGGVLTGRVSQSGDRYIIARDSGELSVSAAKVTMVCRSLEEAYERKRGQITISTVEAHLMLADWCLRYNLLPQAARELLDARGLDPRHPKVALLERRLAVANKPPRTDKSQTAASELESPRAVVEKLAPPRPVAIELPHTSELSNLAIEQFTRKVQPILVNSCSNTGCHQSGSPQQFQLDRAVLHGMSNRRSTLQNLEATLTLIDRQSPHLSQLLTVPRHAHGGMDRAVFGPRQNQLIARLTEWVAIVTNTAPVDETATEASVSEGTRKVATDSSSAPQRGTTLTAKPPAGAPRAGTAIDSGVVQASYEEVPATLAPTPKLRRGAQIRNPPWRPKDPFDAEIFNRQATPAPANNRTSSPTGRGPR